MTYFKTYDKRFWKSVKTLNYICKRLLKNTAQMKKSALIALVVLGTLAASCNLAKTCPTYAKAPNPGVERVK